MNELNLEAKLFNFYFFFIYRLKLIIDSIISLIIAWLFSGLVIIALAGSLYFSL